MKIIVHLNSININNLFAILSKSQSWKKIIINKHKSEDFSRFHRQNRIFKHLHKQIYILLFLLFFFKSDSFHTPAISMAKYIIIIIYSIGIVSIFSEKIWNNIVEPTINIQSILAQHLQQHIDYCEYRTVRNGEWPRSRATNAVLHGRRYFSWKIKIKKTKK